jgi:dCMP deaminase
MPRPTLDEVYLQLLRVFARRSTCARRQVAAILVDERGRVLSCGHNGVPRGFTHCTDVPCLGRDDAHGNNVNCEAVHAEANAVLNCSRLEAVVTAYVSCTPCYECAKLLANLPNLRRVVVTETYADHRGYEILLRAKIEVDEHESVGPISDGTGFTEE